MQKSTTSNWLKGIRGKMLITTLLPMIAYLILGIVSFKGINRFLDLLDIVNNQVVPTFDVLGEMREARTRYLYHVWSAIEYTDNSKQLNARLEAAKQAFQDYKKAQEVYDPIPRTPEEDVFYKEAHPYFDQFYGLMEKIISLIRTGDQLKLLEAKTLLNEDLLDVDAKITKWSDAVKRIYSDLAKEDIKTAETEDKFTKNFFITVSILSALIIFLLSLLISAKISKNLEKIASELSAAGMRVVSTVEHLNESGGSLSKSSTEAAASLEETVASLEEMTSMIQMNSENAKQAATLSIASRESAELGEKEMHSLIESMNQISQSSRKIEEIISVIDDIAFQTNLLALNASVEAARAGEQGKGFAVVAEAVRALAQRSASSAKDISSLIKESVQQIEEGSQIAGKSGEVLNTILSSIKKVADLNNEIAAASAEQAMGITQIGQAMNQLDQASQSNAASAEEIAASSAEINDLASATQKLTIDLNTVISG